MAVLTRSATLLKNKACNNGYLNLDCIERILKFSNKKTVANLRMVSKDVYNISLKVTQFHKFHDKYHKAMKSFHANKNKTMRKKKMLYNIFDILTDNQEFWRLKYDRGLRYETFSANVNKSVWKFLSLSYIPYTKRVKYYHKLIDWETHALKTYKFKF